MKKKPTDKQRLDFISGAVEDREKVISRIHCYEANSGRGYFELALNVRAAIDDIMKEKGLI
jgi:hypothetical protein